tara:strand:- start:366 stop:533 length:168 start_codon:yes stop_codon:yes gene_type:complete
MDKWHVFGRRKGEDPLGFLGVISFEGNPRKVVVEKYGKDWLELVAFPEGSIIKVI